MNDRQEKVLKWTAAAIIAMVMFPPFRSINAYKVEVFCGYSSMFSDGACNANNQIHIPLLALQIAVALIIGGLFYAIGSRDGSLYPGPAPHPQAGTTIIQPIMASPEPKPKRNGLSKFFGGETHPWRRWLARNVDFTFVVILAAIIYGMYSDSVSYRWALFASAIISIIVEACLISWTGTTIGKRAFGITVKDASGENLSFANSLKRSAIVFAYGEGLLVGIWMTGLYWYSKLTKEGTTLWDKETGSVVAHKGWGVGDVVLAFLAYFLSGIIFLFASYIPKDIQQNRVPIESQSHEDIDSPKNTKVSPPKSGEMRSSQSAQHELATRHNYDPVDSSPSDVSPNSYDAQPVPQSDPGDAIGRAIQLHSQGRYAEELSILEPLADQNDPGAQTLLGEMYFNGNGVAQDYAKAFNLFYPAANQGNARAQNNVGWLFLNGFGVTQNYARAAFWYRESADQGHDVAQYHLGVMYADGLGLENDDKQAVYWLQKSADQGFSIAQGYLGAMYAQGRGVGKNSAIALNLIRKAADQGDPWGQYNLGYLYASGDGVGQNYGQAAYWFRKAADQGNTAAVDRLNEINALTRANPRLIPAGCDIKPVMTDEELEACRSRQ